MCHRGTIGRKLTSQGVKDYLYKISDDLRLNPLVLGLIQYGDYTVELFPLI